MAVVAPNPAFAVLPTDERIERTARALENNGFRVIILDSGQEAKRHVLELLPAGAEVFVASSRTTDAIGLTEEVDKAGRFDAVRPRLFQMDRQTQGREMRKLGAAPDYVVGSVHAVTEQGQLLVASATGSQLAPYAYGAGSVIWVVGAQKIVRDLDEGFRRLNEYTFPLEDARARQVYGMPSVVAKVLVVHREVVPERATVVLVKEELGY